GKPVRRPALLRAPILVAIGTLVVRPHASEQPSAPPRPAVKVTGRKEPADGAGGLEPPKTPPHIHQSDYHDAARSHKRCAPLQRFERVRAMVQDAVRDHEIVVARRLEIKKR